MAEITLKSEDGCSVTVNIDGKETEGGSGPKVTKWLRKRGIPSERAGFEVACAQSMGRATFEADLKEIMCVGHP